MDFPKFPTQNTNYFDVAFITVMQIHIIEHEGDLFFLIKEGIEITYQISYEKIKGLGPLMC